jgi:cell division protein FtsN
LQLGAFESEPSARRLQLRAAEHVDSVSLHRDVSYLRVHAGPYDRRKQAEKALRRLREAGFQGVVVVLDQQNSGSTP